MARTGFYDSTQGIYLPKDTLTWDDLGSSPYGSWDTYTTWYKNLSGSTEVEWTTDIIDFGSSRNLLPVVLINTRRDGTTSPAAFSTDHPEVLIEASNNSDMSGSVSTTVTRTTSPEFTALGSYRYYRFTITINSGINTAPQGFTGFEINLLTDSEDEVIENFDTSTVDDGSSTTRTIPTRKTYGGISFVGITPTGTVSDQVVTGVSGGGTGLYVADGYVTTGYFISTTGSVSTSTITTVPLTQLVSTESNSFTIRVFKPNTGTEVDSTFDFYVRGLGNAAMDVNGNIIEV